MNLRCSSLPLAFQCPGSVRTESGEILIKIANEGGPLGSAVHEVMAALVLSHNGDGPDVRAMAMKHGVDADDLARLVAYGLHAWRALAQYYPDPSIEQEMSYVTPAFALSGHIDLHAAWEEWANFLDWKSGYKQPDYFHQLMGYACLLFFVYPSIKTVRATVVWLRDWTQETMLVTREDVGKWEDNLNEHVVHWSGTYTAGAHCVAGHELLVTEHGLIRLSRAASSTENFRLHTGMTGLALTGGVIPKGQRKCINILTELGYEITLTKDHRCLMYDNELEDITWKEAEKIAVGDRIVMSRGGYLGAKGVDIPEVEAELMGMIDGDGWITKSSGETTVGLLLDANDQELIDRYQGAFFSATGAKFNAQKVSHSAAVVRLRSRAKAVGKWADKWGLKGRRISNQVLTLSPRCLSAYLRGLFEADGSVINEGRGVFFYSSIHAFARDVQDALFSLGIISRLSDRSGDTPLKVGRSLWELRICGGENKLRFQKLIGFCSERKNYALCTPENSYTKNDTFPIGAFGCMSAPRLEELLKGKKGQKRTEDRYKKIREWNNQKYHFETISAVKDAGEHDVFDVINSPTDSFVASGFVVHNCQFCPRFATCPARQAMVRSAWVEIEDTPPVIDTIGPNREAFFPALARLVRMGKLAVAKEVIARIEMMVRQDISVNGPLDLGNGRELALVPEPRDTIDPLKAWPIISERLSNEELAPCIKIGKTALLDAVGDKAPRGQKAKVKAELMDELKTAGAVNTTEVWKLRERKIEKEVIA